MKKARIALPLLVGMLISLVAVPSVKAEPALVSILYSLGFTNIAQSSTETFAPGTYEVKLLAEFAAYHASNELSWYEVGTSDFVLLFSGPEGYFDYIIPPIVKSFQADEQFGLSFLSPDARHFTEISRNADGVVHAVVFSNLDNPDMCLLGFENLWGGGDRDYQDMVISLELIRPQPIEAMIDVDPNGLNLRSKGNWITAYVQLLEGHDASCINASTVMLNGTLVPVLDPKYGFITNSSEYLVDHNNDGILERMLKFDRTQVSSFIYNQGTKYDSVALTVNGELFDRTPFEGTDVIFVNYAGDANNDKVINVFDVLAVKSRWTATPGSSNWIPEYDVNCDEAINVFDVLVIKSNWGQETP